MAKSNRKKHETGNEITTPSQYGSHRSMVVELESIDATKQGGIVLQDGEVICKDDKGHYLTLESRLDSGLAYPKRYGKRLQLETLE